ncbi:hypothetical protein C8J57DRAFT_1247985 [Mycena rebaudengoi]|nr:hypothetical protein C8J57DRAFT_1247985 [Mycena rebaudengoi]
MLKETAKENIPAPVGCVSLAALVLPPGGAGVRRGLRSWHEGSEELGHASEFSTTFKADLRQRRGRMRREDDAAHPAKRKPPYAAAAAFAMSSLHTKTLWSERKRQNAVTPNNGRGASNCHTSAGGPLPLPLTNSTSTILLAKESPVAVQGVAGREARIAGLYVIELGRREGVVGLSGLWVYPAAAGEVTVEYPQCSRSTVNIFSWDSGSCSGWTDGVREGVDIAKLVPHTSL